MIVIEQAKALAIKPKYPNKILQTIPTARMLKYEGAELVVAPHKLDEVKVLRNLGFKAPSPILHYYDWAGRYTHTNIRNDFCFPYYAQKSIGT